VFLRRAFSLAGPLLSQFPLCRLAQYAYTFARPILRRCASSLANAIAFDVAWVERARDMERDDQSDQNPTHERPDENAV
jgi:hypothetical protein